MKSIFKVQTKIPLLVATSMLLVAVFLKLPYGYYQLTRWIVCGTAAYFAYQGYENKKPYWLWPLVVIALLFNPISPVHFIRGTWQVIDFIVAIIFGILFFKKQL